MLPVRVHIRKFYARAQQWVCAYCAQQISMVSPANAHIEHIIAKSVNEKFVFEPVNLCVICADCNTIKRAQEVENIIDSVTKRKYVRYPTASSSFKIVHPHFDNWEDHLVIRAGIYHHLTNKGRFTIYCCELNRKFRKLGYSEKLADDEFFIGLMNNFAESRSSQQRAIILEQIAIAVIHGMPED